MKYLALIILAIFILSGPTEIRKANYLGYGDLEFFVVLHPSNDKEKLEKLMKDHYENNPLKKAGTRIYLKEFSWHEGGNLVGEGGSYLSEDPPEAKLLDYLMRVSYYIDVKNKVHLDFYVY